ncbi:uncharacterized protein DMAD_08171 [Drosophila madeirensis]|uniref:Galectin n=1 Tax=Drosophila madeirensis TaxID=30013 RepID=A0AAU9EYA9_DROMD
MMYSDDKTPMLSVLTMKSGFIYKLDAATCVHLISIDLQQGYDANLEIHFDGSVIVEASVSAKNIHESFDTLVWGNDCIALKSESYATADVMGYIDGHFYGVAGQEFMPLEEVFQEIKMPDN